MEEYLKDKPVCGPSLPARLRIKNNGDAKVNLNADDH